MKCISFRRLYELNYWKNKAKKAQKVLHNASLVQGRASIWRNIMVLCQRTNLKIKRESPNRYNRWLLFDSLIKLKRRICTPSLRQPIHVNMRGDIKMVYLGFVCHGLDREFELDSDLTRKYSEHLWCDCGPSPAGYWYSLTNEPLSRRLASLTQLDSH